MRLCAPTGKAARRLAEITGAPGDDDPPPARVRRPARASPAAPRTRSRAPTCSSSTRPRCSPCAWPRRCSAPSARARTCCSSATSTSSRRSAPAACSTTSSSPGAVPVVRLTEIFRQAARSLIVRAAHAVNAGEPPPTRRRRRATCATSSSSSATAPTPIRDEVVALASAAPAGALRPRPARRGPRRSRRCTAGRRASTRSTPSCARG